MQKNMTFSANLILIDIEILMFFFASASPCMKAEESWVVAPMD